MRMQLSEVAEVFGNRWQGEELLATGISTDSRTTQKGDLFFALVGENFDGHNFLSAASEKGAVAAIISRKESANDSFIATIQIADTTKGLGLLAQHWHQQCDSKTIAITGSVGKTTVKEMLAVMLSKDAEVCVTSGNFNNHIGLPLTLFKETREDQVAIIEMGASGKGEIAELCKIAAPKVGIITQVADAHLSGFGSISGVAEAKSELFLSLPETGIAIINLDSAELEQLLKASSHCRQSKVSLNKHLHTDFWAEQIKTHDNGWVFNCCSPQQQFSVTINIPGKHNIVNALLAIAGVSALGFDAKLLSAELTRLQSVPGRLEVSQLPHQGKLFDDSYNANPTSVKAAIDMLAEQSGNNILVLGDMGELGDEQVQLHKECGEYAQDRNIQQLYSFGELSANAALSFGENGKIFSDKKLLINQLFSQLSAKTNIVIKGSRSAKMEQVVNGLLEKLARESSQKGNLQNLKNQNNNQKNKNKQEQI